MSVSGEKKPDAPPGEAEYHLSVAIGRLSTVEGDIAATYASQLHGEDLYTHSQWVRLRWKLNLRLVPLVWFNVTFSAMDKVTTSRATLYGFRQDTGLTGDRYSWVGSAFYVQSLPGLH